MAGRTNKSKKWWREQRKSQEARCIYCRDHLSVRPITLEHIVPRSWGGPSRAGFNLVIACQACQHDKSKWECKSTVLLEGSPGITKCAAFLEYVIQMGSKPKVLVRYGHRNVVFSNVIRVFQETLWHPDWRWLIPHKREIFFGPSISRDYLDPLSQQVFENPYMSR